jgi:hypothetical protein
MMMELKKTAVIEAIFDCAPSGVDSVFSKMQAVENWVKAALSGKTDDYKISGRSDTANGVYFLSVSINLTDDADLNQAAIDICAAIDAAPPFVHGSYPRFHIMYQWGEKQEIEPETAVE